MLKFIYLFTLLIAFVFADVVDYLKSTDRTFNEIEGKVPKLSVEMDPKDYEKLVEKSQISQQEDIIEGCNLDASCLEDYETKVTLTYELDGEKKVFKKVNFKTGGNYGRGNDRIGFNLKLKGDDRLFDRKQLRVRPDASDSTHMKSKLAYDLLNNWGLPSLQETYVEFYINDEYFGLYMLQDALKLNWIRKTYHLPEDEEVETLFYCRKDGVNLAKGDVCFNQNDKTANYTEPFEELLENIEGAKTVEDLEKFMNVDLVMKNLAIEFLFGSFDHYIIQGHNFYLYQRKDGIWDMILVDFDSEFGSGLAFLTFVLNYNIEDYGYRLKFEDMPQPGKKLLGPAYFNDTTHFKKALRELLVTGFNPDALFKRIEELKEFLAPYVKKATTPRADGQLPGVINLKGIPSTHTFEDFLSVSNIENTNPFVPSLKSWIQNRFDFACEEYGFDKEEILREAAEYRGEEYIPKTDEELETEIETEFETEFETEAATETETEYEYITVTDTQYETQTEYETDYILYTTTSLIEIDEEETGTAKDNNEEEEEDITDINDDLDSEIETTGSIEDDEDSADEAEEINETEVADASDNTINDDATTDVAEEEKNESNDESEVEVSESFEENGENENEDSSDEIETEIADASNNSIIDDIATDADEEEKDESNDDSEVEVSESLEEENEDSSDENDAAADDSTEVVTEASEEESDDEIVEVSIPEEQENHKEEEETKGDDFNEIPIEIPDESPEREQDADVNEAPIEEPITLNNESNGSVKTRKKCIVRKLN